MNVQTALPVARLRPTRDPRRRWRNSRTLKARLRCVAVFDSGEIVFRLAYPNQQIAECLGGRFVPFVFLSFNAALCYRFYVLDSREPVSHRSPPARNTPRSRAP